MRFARVFAFALLAGCSFFVPAALADEPGPAPAPPAPAGPPPPPSPVPDDIQRAIHEAELKLKEAKDAGREREEAEIRATLDRMRAARKEAQQAREKMLVEEKARHDRDVADAKAKEAAAKAEKLLSDPAAAAQALHAELERAEGIKRAVDVLHGVVEQDGKLRLDGADGQVVIFGDGTNGQVVIVSDGVDGDASTDVQLAALKQLHDRLLDDLRAAEKAGDKEVAERLREKSRVVEEKLKSMMSRASREQAGPAHYYRQLEFKVADPAAAGVAELDRRLAALRQAAKLLKEAGMPDRLRGLQEDIGRLERERALAMAAAQAGGPGPDASALVQEVHALREQVEALRHELREMRAMLEKAIAK